MGLSLAARVAILPPAQRRAVLRAAGEIEALSHSWRFWSRPEQRAPSGDWRVWLILAGRGFGKTRSGAEWVRNVAEGNPRARIALVGRTAADVRDIMLEGPSGILSCCPQSFAPWYEPSKRRIVWPNGARAICYSADEPNLLRGPNHTHAWADELAAWQYDDAWDQLEMGLRLGDHPRAVVTTTPRPTKLIRNLTQSEGTVITRGSTYDNAANLADTFIARMKTKYEGTRLGRQELFAEILDDAPGALWKNSMLEGIRVRVAPELVRVVVAVDPAVTSNSESDETGIIVAGLGADGEAYVLGDYTMRDTPDAWAKEAVAAYRRHQADRVVCEVNNGGDLVEKLLRTVDPRLPIRQVRATRGKALRAEPVAALYEQKRVHHVGSLPRLEDQMTSWEPGVSAKSPDRVDALVYAITDLLLDREGVPRVRVIDYGPRARSA